MIKPRREWIRSYEPNAAEFPICFKSGSLRLDLELGHCTEWLVAGWSPLRTVCGRVHVCVWVCIFSLASRWHMMWSIAAYGRLLYTSYFFCMKLDIYFVHYLNSRFSK